MPQALSTPPVVAAVDLGSNSFHMKVARVERGRIHVIDRMRERVRLAAGLDEDTMLSAEAMDRALRCLERFGQRLRAMPRGTVRAVGTNTLRRARNAPQFLIEAKHALGHSIYVIAGREEARLVYLGVAHSIAPDHRRRLVIDIGGGSTELIIGREFQPVLTESLHMGCVAMTRQFFPGGRIREADMRDAEVAALQELENVREVYRGFGWDTALGSSGTVLSIGAAVRSMGWSRRGITARALRKLRKAVIEAGNTDRLTTLGVAPDRAVVFPGGLAILSAAFDALGIQRMRCSAGSLREGLLFDLLGRFSDHDVREATISDLCQRYRVDLAQAQRVEHTAARLREQVAGALDIQKEKYEHLLRWAARLHEVGLAIAHAQYHKHGAYLVENSDLAGFSRHEQSLLAALVRSHRRKLPMTIFAGLPGNSGKRTFHSALVLRLVIVLHRSRTDAALPDIVLQAEDGVLQLRFPEGWLADHPLTAADLRQEASYLKAAGITLRVSGSAAEKSDARPAALPDEALTSS